MSSCNFTRQILPSECIGDSLATINNNFLELDVNLCGMPRVVPGIGTEVSTYSSEQLKNSVAISTRNNFQYVTDFESVRSTQLSSVTLKDGTILKTTRFPYYDSIADYKPTITFTSTALTDATPHVTLCWMASGADSTTVFALNSSTSVADKGLIWPNGSVKTLLVDGSKLYVGGDFTEIGGTTARKFCEINLEAGNLNPVFLNTGLLTAVSFSDPSGDLGPEGSVDAMDYDPLSGFLAVGGTFKGINRGKSLCVLNKKTNQVYPFYVNGKVNALKIINDNLYVGGEFDYVNYGSESASVLSNKRVQTNGFCAISLYMMTKIPYGSIIGYQDLFSGPATVNAIQGHENYVFVGGSFVIKDVERVVCQNLCVVNGDEETLSDVVHPIINGPVHSLTIDDTTADGQDIYLYVGGKFNKYYTEEQFNSNPRKQDPELNDFSNVMCLAFDKDDHTSVSVQKYWKPTFNGPIFKIITDGNDADGKIYCYGQFTSVNSQNRQYLVCLNKSSKSFDSDTGNTILWSPYIEKGPSLNNQALARYGNTIIVGGTFSKVGKSLRYNLARINDSQTVPSLSSVYWDFACKLVSPGMDYNFDFTDLVRLSASPSSFGTVNYTMLPVNPEIFNGYTEGQNVRFLLRRAGNSQSFGNLGPVTDNFKQSVDVLGIKIDYNH